MAAQLQVSGAVSGGTVMSRLSVQSSLGWISIGAFMLVGSWVGGCGTTVVCDADAGPVADAPADTRPVSPGWRRPAERGPNDDPSCPRVWRRTPAAAPSTGGVIGVVDGALYLESDVAAEPSQSIGIVRSGLDGDFDVTFVVAMDPTSEGAVEAFVEQETGADPGAAFAALVVGGGLAHVAVAAAVTGHAEGATGELGSAGLVGRLRITRIGDDLVAESAAGEAVERAGARMAGRLRFGVRVRPGQNAAERRVVARANAFYTTMETSTLRTDLFACDSVMRWGE
jgi:hypothetical protein